MNNELLQFILKTQKIEFAEFDSSLRLIQASLGASQFCSPVRGLEAGMHITDVFIELVGYDEELASLQSGNPPSLQLSWINRTPLSALPGSDNDHQPITFFNLQVFPYESHLLVILRDVSEESAVEQSVYNRRNELDVLSKQLIEDLKRANAELNEAYKTTLEGWAHALELRDYETMGHSERVVNLTQKLVISLGVDPSEYDSYCYGALLHDIGKMGIPDHILLKTGALDEKEWAIMRRHPLFAQKLLSPIKFLEKALIIPIYHHEKWRGGGYPYGLRGEEIPLAARIFSVVDVYDALTSDRPYRPAWPKVSALRYISEKSGFDFDPRVVSHFLSFFPDFGPSK